MSNSRIIIGVLLIVLGISFLTGFPIFRYILPIIIIIIGLSIVFGKGNWGNFGNQQSSSEEFLNRVCLFSAINTKSLSKNFQGGEFTAIFGGGEVDLRDAESKSKNIKINITAIFGGLKLYLPKNWKVYTNGVGIIGGFDNKTKPNEKGQTTVVVDGAAIFGGVEIVNN